MNLVNSSTPESFALEIVDLRVNFLTSSIEIGLQRREAATPYKPISLQAGVTKSMFKSNPKHQKQSQQLLLHETVADLFSF